MNDGDEKKYIDNKNLDKIYVSKRIASENPDGSHNNIRYVSKVIDSEKYISFFKKKDEVQLRLTSGGRQEVLAKTLEDSNGIYCLTLQKFTSKTGSPHKIYFSFVGEEIKKLKNFLDNIPLIKFSENINKFNIYDQNIE